MQILGNPGPVKFANIQFQNFRIFREKLKRNLATLSLVTDLYQKFKFRPLVVKILDWRLQKNLQYQGTVFFFD
jgi:hypothetical protein